MGDISNTREGDSGYSNRARVREGMHVYAANDRLIGAIDGLHGDGFHVNGEHIPASAIARVTENRVYLSGRGEQDGTLSEARTEGQIRVPIVEERLDVEKRQGQVGEVGIHREMIEEQQSVPVDLMREEVHVERRDVADRPLSDSEAETAFEEGTIRVPVRGEEAIVTKEAIVTGEVVVTKERTTERQMLTDTVRKQRVDIDEEYDRARSGFQQHFTGRQRTVGDDRTFEQAEGNYRMGYEAGYDERYAGREFEDIEPDLRRTYEGGTRGRGASWEHLREEIREGWRRARGT